LFCRRPRFYPSRLFEFIAQGTKRRKRMPDTAMYFLEEHHILMLLIQLLVLMGCARGAG
jgi:hypothetical protein